MELDSWKLQGFGDAKISPQLLFLLIFIEDHLNYYKGDMKNISTTKRIFSNIRKRVIRLLLSKGAQNAIDKYYKGKIKGDVVEASKKILLKSWRPLILGEHNKENIALTVKACEALGISKSDIKKALKISKEFPGGLNWSEK